MDLQLLLKLIPGLKESVRTTRYNNKKIRREERKLMLLQALIQKEDRDAFLKRNLVILTYVRAGKLFPENSLAWDACLVLIDRLLEVLLSFFPFFYSFYSSVLFYFFLCVFISLVSSFFD